MIFPIVEEMHRVIAGMSPLFSHDEFITRFGRVYVNYRRSFCLGDFHAPLRPDLFQERDAYIREFGFAIPCREAICTIIDGGPVVEIGAGTGYWAKLIAAVGGDIVATDAYEHAYNGWAFGRYFPVASLAGKTAVRRYRDRNVFCSWPTLNATWFRQALKAMRIGRFLYYVEEDATAEAGAAALIEDFFIKEASIPIPCFYGMNDQLTVYRKIRQRSFRDRQAEIANERMAADERRARWLAARWP